MKKPFQVKPEQYGFPSKIGGMTIKTITWKDFPAKPPENTWFLAYTYWNTNWVSTIKNGKGTILATVSIGPKAWTRAEEDFKLLQHETGHYWIACLCALQFQKRVNYIEKKPDGVNFAQWCQGIFKKTASQYAQQQKRYDKETYHYLNQQDQQRWKHYMIDKFNEYHKFFQQKKKESEKIEPLKRIQSKEINRRATINIDRDPKRLPITKIVTDKNPQKAQINYKQNETDNKRPPKQFSVRKTNIITNQKTTNKNFKVFEQAKNTILGNINVLEGLK